MLPNKRFWAFQHNLFESPAKVGNIIEATLIGNRRNVLIRLDNEIAGMVNTNSIDHLRKCFFGIE